MRTTAISGAALFTLLLGCGFAGELDRAFSTCTSDEQCGADQVCFPDGCGDPGLGLVVEVLPNASNGQFAQDFAIPELKPTQNIEALEPAVIQGVMQQESASGGVIAYSGTVSMIVNGESALIPGRTRSVQYKVTPQQGAFQIPVPTGSFTVTTLPEDVLYPPSVIPEVVVSPGEAKNLELSFPALASLMQVHGKLLSRADDKIAIQTAEMQVQAFDPETGEMLSQRADASSGQNTSDGSFYLWVKPRIGVQKLRIVASPKTADAHVPSKSFDLDFVPEVGILELGDYGAATTISGFVQASNQQPIEGATVYVEGIAGGGGKYKSTSTTTDANGMFTLKTLPSVNNASLELVAVPPPKSQAGQLRARVKIAPTGGDLGEFTAPDKIDVLGSLTLPDGTPATAVVIEATPIASVKGHPQPAGITKGTTDDTGRFTVRLDPGTYRLDFIPFDNYPRVSRFVKVEPIVGSTGDGFEPITLPNFALSRGRTVTGTVSSIPRRLSQTDPVLTPYALVKFFRVVTFDQQRSSILLAEGVADETGKYKVVLPTR